ncbi:8448_t:CDS:10 [Diversispora eburnea]|uniref:Protein HIR n=1 Tax=Diversispora eburnea TaxID=1213867 RepID=A0A9N9BBL6_9GLOM|nr:8448_t:CDS:10 [Diversispora eburnea]
MHLAKPSWLAHSDDKNQRTSIFSIHVHPDGTRLATGGLGPVLCVRWSNNEGIYLASGSDDQLVLIWQWDKSSEGWAGGSVFGSAEQNIENWKPVKRLTGHQSDVVDLSWSKDNTYLASCGLDSLVFIWDGKTFEKLHKLDKHAGFVKGVTWDPVGEYLATESDDKTVRIWETTSWTVQATISDPYTSSPTTTFYRRLSWSPDGSHVATANGAQGPIPIAAIFNRGKWQTDVSLVGHESAIEVVSFNPVLFMIPESDDADPSSATLGSICAVGSQDHSISVWVTRNARPLFVCQKPFEHNGTHLYACSYDGTVVVLQFLNNEFGEREKLLMKYGFRSKDPILIENQTQLSFESEYAITRNKNSNEIPSSDNNASSAVIPMETSVSETELEPIIYVPPRMKSPSPSTSTNIPLESSSNGKKRIQPRHLGLGSLTSTLQSTRQDGTNQMEGVSGEMEAPSRALPLGGVNVLMIGNKRKDSDTSDKKPTQSEIESHVLRPSIVSPSILMSQIRLASHKVRDYLAKDRLDGATLKLECFNYLNNLPTKLICSRGKISIWFDFLPSAIILMTGNAQYSAVACEDGSIYTYSNAGNKLESTASFLEICRDYLLCLTQVGLLSVWDLRNRQAKIDSVSIAPILSSASLSSDSLQHTVSIVTACVRSNGIPLLITSTSDAWCYHTGMRCWTCVYDPRYTLPNPSRQESIGDVTGNYILSSLENMARQRGANIGSLAYLRRPGISNVTAQSPNNLLGFLQNQLLAAELVNSPSEYKQLLLAYAQQLADEGAESKLHELCIQLLGPTYIPEGINGVQPQSNWDPFLLGMSKRQLLDEVLKILSSNRTLQRHVSEYKNALNTILNLD